MEIVLLIIVILLTSVLLFFTFDRKHKGVSLDSSNPSIQTQKVQVQPLALQPQKSSQTYQKELQEQLRLQEYQRPEEHSRPLYSPRPEYSRPLYRPYGPETPGPYPGSIQNIPVPAGALKATNGLYTFTPDYGYRVPHGGILPQQSIPLPSDSFFRPYNPSPFVGSVDAFLPFPEVNTPWEKVGILTSQLSDSGTKELLNLYQRPIAPMQELWEYQVQDKDGFIIKLDIKKYLENGDVIYHIIGKPGSWKANIFVQNKYIWV